jgi:hypothetical protein
VASGNYKPANAKTSSISEKIETDKRLAWFVYKNSKSN